VVRVIRMVGVVRSIDGGRGGWGWSMVVGGGRWWFGWSGWSRGDREGSGGQGGQGVIERGRVVENGRVVGVEVYTAAAPGQEQPNTWVEGSAAK
jgi:hypothetical protein